MSDQQNQVTAKWESDLVITHMITDGIWMTRSPVAN